MDCENSVMMDSPDIFSKFALTQIDVKNPSLYSLARQSVQKKLGRNMQNNTMVRPPTTTRDLIALKRNEPVLVDRTLKFQSLLQPSTTVATDDLFITDIPRIQSALGVRTSIDSDIRTIQPAYGNYSSLMT